MNDIYTWPNDLYPLIKKRFDLRYGKRLDLIDAVCETVTQDEIEYKLEGVSGFGVIPEYNGEYLSVGEQKRGFVTTITPKEHALSVPLSYKRAKVDLSGEAAKIGTRLADSAYMTVLADFYNVFGDAFTKNGFDGVPWASTKHPVNSSEDSETFSNLINGTLSVASILEAQKLASTFTTPDGLPFIGNYDLLLVSPELEGKAKEICGANAKLCPEKNPDADAGVNAANPVYGMKYMVVGAGTKGFTGGMWAIADSMLLREIFKLIYISKPTVLVARQDNPLVTDYVAYVDYAFGYADARPIIFSDPDAAL